MAIISKKYAHLNTSDSGSLHKKLDATEAYITGSLTAASTLSVAGQADFDDKIVVDLDITGSANLNIALESNLQGAVYAGGLLDVAGDADFAQAVRITGELTGSAAALLSSTLKVDGQADMVDVLPQADLSYDLGSPALRWAELHAGTAAFTNLEVDYLDVAVTASVAQLTGSAGAVFSAGDVLVQAGKVSASSDLQAGGALAVAGNADLNGALDVALAADLHGAVVAYSTLNVQGAADLDTTLNVDGIATFQDDVYAKADLNVSGALEVALTANVVGNFSVATNKFTVAASSGDTAVAGDLIVSGDLTVMGDRIEAQISELRVEDGLITLMSGSTGRLMSNSAGIEVEVGSGNGELPVIKFASALGGASGSWESNLDWIPTEDLKYDLGIATRRWRELNISGNANVGGDLDVTGAASVGALDAASLAVSGEATFGAGIAVTGTGSFTGDIAAASASFSGDLTALGMFSVLGNASFSSDISAFGSASFGGNLVVGTPLGGGEINAASMILSGDITADDAAFNTLSVVGLSDLDAVQVAGPATFAQSIAVTGSGSFTGDISAVSASLSGDLSAVNATLTGDLSAASGSFSGDLDVYGTATFHGTFAVPGTGDFGSLVVGGINMSPISSSNPVSTVDAGNAVMMAQTLIDDGDMAKFEIEVIARGGENAAAWKISVAAMRDGGTATAAATELSKEFFGALGAQLDVDINTVAGMGAAAPAIQVIVKGAASAGTVYWDAQIVKKMVLGNDGSRKY
jgi:hypothetical protein